MAATPSSMYPPLKARSIRLLHLEAGQHDDPIRFSLESVSLDSKPIYEAISYCWGNPHSRQNVTCRGISMSITTSLLGALREFRDSVEHRVLWADGVCINQADENEKTRQVRLMHEIYAKANTVLVWLGPMDDSGLLSNIPTWIKRSNNVLPDFYQKVPPEENRKFLFEVEHPDQRHDWPDVDWKAISELIRRPWFTRKWVVQEVAMAQEVRLYIGGGIQLPWSDVSSLAGKFYLLGTHALMLRNVRPEEHVAFGAGLHHLFIMRDIAHFRAIGKGTLVDAAMMTGGFLCSDPRDQIYGILSCVSQGPSMDPDYTLSIEDTFKKFSQVMLTETRNLNVLSLEPHKGNLIHPCIARNKTGLPSWVADLRLAANPMASPSVYARNYLAGGSQSPMLSFSGDGRFLHCQGIIVDEIEDCVPSTYEMLKDERPELFETYTVPFGPGDPSLKSRHKRYQRWLRGCYNLGYAQASALNEESRKNAFACTLLCEQGSSSGGEASAEIIKATLEYVEHILYQDDNDTSPPAQRLDKTPEESLGLPKLWTIVSSRIALKSLMRKFSITTGARLGQMPIGTERGDLVCILIGGEVPFVIRPTGPGSTKYHLIGDFFLNSVMNGEMLVANEHVTRQIVLA